MSDTLTVAQLVQRTRRHLAGAESAPLNILAAAIGTSDATVVFTYELEAIQPSSYISLGDEILYVWATDPGTFSATVSRGMLGTTAEAHVINSTVEAPTRFPTPIIKDALQEEVRSWPDSVFSVDSLDLEWVSDESVIDLELEDDEWLWVIEVLAGPHPNNAPQGDKWVPVRYKTHRQLSEVETGSALQINEPYQDTTRALRVLVARPFVADTVDDGDNVVTEWGVPRSMLDIIPMGAAARLLMGAEAVRTDTDVMQESRQAEQVPPQFLSQTAMALQRVVKRRLDQEAMRLRGRYNIRQSA